MTFGGDSYIRYRLKESFNEPSRSISLALRTAEPQGTLVFAAGQYDYSILEVCSMLTDFNRQLNQLTLLYKRKLRPFLLF